MNDLRRIAALHPWLGRNTRHGRSAARRERAHFTAPRSMGSDGRTLLIVLSGDEGSGSLEMAGA